MEDVAILREAQPRIGRIGLAELLQYSPHHRAGVPRHGAELRQHRRSASYHAVQNRHTQIPTEKLRDNIETFHGLLIVELRRRWSASQKQMPSRRVLIRLQQAVTENCDGRNRRRCFQSFC